MHKPAAHIASALCIKVAQKVLNSDLSCSEDLCQFLQQFAQPTGSKFNSRKPQRLSAIPVAINLYLLNSESIKLDLNFLLTFCFYYQTTL